MAVCNFSVDSSLLLPIANIAVSSAKVATVLLSNTGRSLVYSRYRTGLKHFLVALCFYFLKFRISISLLNPKESLC